MLASVGKAKISISSAAARSIGQRTVRTKFMTTAEMIERYLLKKGDIVSVKGHPESIATIEDHRTVIYNNRPMSWNKWAKDITKWSAVNIYANVMKDGRTLDEIRTAAQELLDQESDMLENGDEQCVDHFTG